MAVWYLSQFLCTQYQSVGRFQLYIMRYKNAICCSILLKAHVHVHGYWLSSCNPLALRRKYGSVNPNYLHRYTTNGYNIQHLPRFRQTPLLDCTSDHGVCRSEIALQSPGREPVHPSNLSYWWLVGHNTSEIWRHSWISRPGPQSWYQCQIDHLYLLTNV